jgi:UDP-N-acetylglucosamine 1-carboxyvinyltransferase
MLENARAELLQTGLDVLAKAGLEYNETNRGLRVARNGRGLTPVEVTTEPFPGFPTDLQAQLMALMTRAEGTSRITETIFENRFMHVQELARLGAHIHLEGECATIEGVDRLNGAPLLILGARPARAPAKWACRARLASGLTLLPYMHVGKIRPADLTFIP